MTKDQIKREFWERCFLQQMPKSGAAGCSYAAKQADKMLEEWESRFGDQFVTVEFKSPLLCPDESIKAAQTHLFRESESRSGWVQWWNPDDFGALLTFREWISKCGLRELDSSEFELNLEEKKMVLLSWGNLEDSVKRAIGVFNQKEK